MKLSTRARYGTRALLGIVLHWDEEPVLLKDIKQSQQIPLRYLERLIRPPVQVETTKTTRGTRGEVSLINPSKDGMLKRDNPAP
jgi:Rrf2 family cysteine metabolism transcriptional repressor